MAIESFFLSGRAANACVQAQGLVVSSEDPLFLKAELQNGDPRRPFRFGSLGVNPKVEFDNNIVFNPSLELDAAGTSPPTGYQAPTGGGSPDVSTDAANEGSKSLRLNLANEAAFQDRIVRPGGSYRHTVALRGDGTNIVSAHVLDLISGKWLVNATTWSTAKTAWATRSAASFAVSSINFTLESPVAGHVGPGRIRLLWDRPGTIAGAAYVDSIYLWPKITVAALVYDTIPTAFPVAIESADNAAFSTNLNDHGDLPARRFRRYLVFAGPATAQRFWRFAVTGTPFDLFRLWIGQPVLGERRIFLTNQRYGLVTARVMPKAGTRDQPTSLAEAPRYRFEMSWASSYASFRQVAEEMVGASFHGDEPVLAVPDSTQPEMVYGRGGGLAEISTNWEPNDFHEYGLSFEDDQYPVLTK